MSSAKRPHSVFEAWAPETPTVASKPSWIARKAASTKPPAAPPRPPAVPAIEEATFAEGERESAVIEKAQPAAPPPAVDLGLSAALAQMAEENAELRAQVTEMAATMVRLKREVLESSEPELVRLALTIAERVVGHELSKNSALVVDWARESIEVLAAKDEVVIALARDVAAQVPSGAWSTIEVPHSTTTDPALAAGTIEIRTPEGVVVDGAPSRFGAVAEALGLAES